MQLLIHWIYLIFPKQLFLFFFRKIFDDFRRVFRHLFKFHSSKYIQSVSRFFTRFGVFDFVPYIPISFRIIRSTQVWMLRGPVLFIKKPFSEKKIIQEILHQLKIIPIFWAETSTRNKQILQMIRILKRDLKYTFLCLFSKHIV